MCKTFHDGCRALIIHLLFRFPLQKGTEPEIAQFPISLRRRRRRRRRNQKDSLSFPAREGLKWGPPRLAWPPTSRDPWIHKGCSNVQMNKWNKVLNDTAPLWGAGWHDRLSLTKRHKENLCPSQVQRRFWVYAVMEVFSPSYEKEKVDNIKCRRSIPQPANLCCQ